MISVEKMLEDVERSFNEKDYRKAIKTCNEILKADLNNQTAMGYKARSLYLLDEHDEAVKLLENAMKTYPGNYHYPYILAEMLMDEGEYGAAIECFERISEIGVGDETLLSFIMTDYETCLSLKVDNLIESEKYGDAFECYRELLKIRKIDLKRPDEIAMFKRHVRKKASKPKSRQYHVRISSNHAKAELIGFLRKNGFESSDSQGLLFLIDVVDKTFNAVDDAGNDDIISESKFYDKVNRCPWDEIEYKKIFSEEGKLLYEGYTLHNAPYGFGTAYFDNGNIYREGIFDIKGIVQGKEYYPSGQLRFEGIWALTGGYGPNAPYDGNAYGEDGKLIYSGKFEIKRGGVGWPMIQKPKGFAPEQKERPKIQYY